MEHMDSLVALYGCAGLFAGKPAPTGSAQVLRAVQYLWERVYPRRGRHRKADRAKLSPLNSHSIRTLLKLG
ncbi:protein of unknown function [Pseudomonas sp. JV551A1]|nr:protein of unknown function [Pseudomonas sp. JV551A1]